MMPPFLIAWSSLSLVSGLCDLNEGSCLQAGSTYQRSVNIWLLEKIARIFRFY